MPARAIRVILRQAGLILLAAVVAGLLVNQLRGDRLAVHPSRQQGPVTGDTAPASGAKMVDMDTARRWFENASAIFIDARDKYGFAESHVPGAIHLDALEADVWMMDIYRRLPQDGRLITYADADTDERALLLAQRLTEIGFKSVYYLENGWQGWLDQGLPVSDTLTAVPGLDR